ncbi:hypothetical protein D046_4204B, partial [Vibrio parahaemolyticus V-223/04]
ICLTD